MTTPHDAAQQYLWAACRGEKQSYDRVAAHASDISKNQGGGSGNWPIQIAVGASINRESRGQDLGPFLRGENGWGLNGNEHGSSIYESWNVASVVALLAKGESKYRSDARRWLRAEYAKRCLGMRRKRPSRSVVYVEGERDYTPRDPSGSWGLSTEPPDGWRYSTDNQYGSRLYSVAPGNRQTERFNRHDPSRPQEHVLNLDRDQVPCIVAWALRYSERRFPKGPPESSTRSQAGWGWPIAIMELVLGKKFEQDLSPESFGLEQGDVDVLRGFLDGGRTDPSVLLPYLSGYGSTSSQEQRWVGLAGGEVLSWINRTIHGSTTGCVVAWSEGNTVHWFSPTSTIRSSGTARCEDLGAGRFALTADHHNCKSPPVRREIETYAPAGKLWEVAWDASGFRLEGAEPPPGGSPQPPQPEPPPGQQVPRPSEIDESIDASGRAMAHYPAGGTVWGLIGNLAETLNRLGGQVNTGSGQRQLAPEEVAPLVVEACEHNLALARKL